MHSRDPKAKVNGILLGPSAIGVWVDVPIISEAFLWRPPSASMAKIKDVIHSAIHWPANKVILENEEENIPSPVVKISTYI